VKTWTKEQNIFELDQLLIPINEALHWYLAIIINPGYLVSRPLEPETEPVQDPATEEAAAGSQKDIFEIDLADPAPPPQTPIFKPGEEGDPDRLQRTYIIILDSLFNNRTSTMTRLKNYLVHEGRAKLGLELDPSLIRGMTIKDAPRQDNLTDCGCFLLEYVEETMRHLDTIRPELILQNHTWFPMEQAKARRRRMAEVMDEMALQYRVMHPDMHQVIDLGNSSDVEEIASID
jgi:Ulp1 family protease